MPSECDSKSKAQTEGHSPGSELPVRGKASFSADTDNKCTDYRVVFAMGTSVPRCGVEATDRFHTGHAAGNGFQPPMT